MSVSSTTGGRSRSLILAAMIFAVAMTFIDQTIVSIAAPTIQHDLGLSSSGMQWAINAYLLALAAFFAFGGRLADTVGHRKMVVLGVIIFAGASALCGLTPSGGIAETWLVAFRALQGLGGAIMFPAAIAIVVRNVRSALSRPGPGAVLRHRRGPDRDRPDRGRLPAGVDLAGDLLDQHPGRAHRPGADRHLQAGHRAPPRADGLSRPGPHRHRRRPERVRPAAVGDLGLGQPGHRGVHRRGHRDPRGLLRRGAPDRFTPDQRAHLREPARSR